MATNGQDGFLTVRLENVPRERNKAADALANRGVDDWLAGPGAGWTPDPPRARLFGGEEPSS